MSEYCKYFKDFCEENNGLKEYCKAIKKRVNCDGTKNTCKYIEKFEKKEI